MNLFIFIHSILGWVLLLLLLLSLIFAVTVYKKKKYNQYSKIYLAALIMSHFQVLLGVYQYFISAKVSLGEGFMSNSMLRFFSVEHPLLMIIAVVLMTIGYSKSKKKQYPNKTIFIYYLIGTVLILSRFPWQYLTLSIFR